MELKSLLQCSQDPADGPNLEPHESNPHPHPLFQKTSMSRNFINAFQTEVIPAGKVNLIIFGVVIGPTFFYGHILAVQLQLLPSLIYDSEYLFLSPNLLSV
jgi:hypothetical protein